MMTLDVREQYGKFVCATVRHRIDSSGANTSWALVTMDDERAKQAVLRATDVPSPLVVNDYNVSAAKNSTGAMKMTIEQHGQLTSEDARTFDVEIRSFGVDSTTVATEWHPQEAQADATLSQPINRRFRVG